MKQIHSRYFGPDFFSGTFLIFSGRILHFFLGKVLFFLGRNFPFFFSATIFFLGQFSRFFLGHFGNFSGRKLKIFSGWNFFFSGKKKNTDLEHATRAKRESPGLEAANTEALYIQAFIGERASPNPRVKAFKEGEEGEGAKRHYSLRHEPLSIFTADLLLPWSSVARYEVRLPQVNCE